MLEEVDDGDFVPTLRADDFSIFREYAVEHLMGLEEAVRNRDAIGGLMVELRYFRRLQRLHRCGLPVDDAIAKEAPYAKRALECLVEHESIVKEFLDEVGR
jgi:hypothetical protein